MLLLKLAFLNIGRNPRRSVITIAAVAVGLSALIFLWGFSDGTSEQQRENVIRFFTGHVQLHAAGYEKNLSPELTLANKSQALETLRKDSRVVSFAERIKCEALVGTSENSRGVLLIGVQPEEESKVTQIGNQVKAGAFLTKAGSRDIVIGRNLGEKLRAGVGDKVVLLTQAVDGTMAGYSYRVKGLLETGSQQIDEQTAFITLASARELLSLDNQSHEVVIRLKSRKDISSFLQAMSSHFKPAEYEFITWDQIVPSVEEWVLWSEAVIRTILVTVMIVIGVGIMNTILMSVYERTRELGVMLAIGTSPWQIVQLILLETLILEFLGIVLGVLGGYAAVFYFSKVGITFHGVEHAFATSFMSTTIYTQVEARHVIHSIQTLILMTTFIGLYPAWKAGKMEPVKAIYHSY